MIKITFPDGSIREYEKNVTPLQIAESISSRLAADVLVANVNDEIVGLDYPIENDAKLSLLNGMTRKANTHSGILLPT